MGLFPRGNLDYVDDALFIGYFVLIFLFKKNKIDFSAQFVRYYKNIISRCTKYCKIYYKWIGWCVAVLTIF